MASGIPTSPPFQDLSPARADRGGSLQSEAALKSRLAEIASDRAASAAQIVQETARILRDWMLEDSGPHGSDGAALEAELAQWNEGQAWRGPCAAWLDALRRRWALGSEAAGAGASRNAEEILTRDLVEEMDLWLDHGDPAKKGRGPRRLPSRVSLAERAASDAERGDTILITSWSETVALSLEAAWRAGSRPEVWIGEGLPHLDGRRMARRLSRAGIVVTMVYDSSLLAVLPRADRVWIATEAIGAGAFLARTGTRVLLEECARRDIPVRVLATSDKLMPGGSLRLPAWCEHEGWLLWEDAPEGVRLETQIFEAVPLDLAGGFLTEAGRETAAALHLRALRVEAAPPCGARPARSLAPATTFLNHA